MSLRERLQTDLSAAMKARDPDRVRALRMAIAAVKNAAVAANLGPPGELDDAAVQKVLASEVKRRREAAAAFRSGGREDRAVAEEAEEAVYREYLPAELDDAALIALVDAAIAGAGDAGPQAMGQVMKAVMAQVAGRADGARVSALVRERLSSGG